VKPDFSSITNASKCNLTIPSGIINNFIRDFKLFSSRDEIGFSKSNVYLSGKAGPQGPATLSALENIPHFTPDEIDFISGLTDKAGVD